MSTYSVCPCIQPHPVSIERDPPQPAIEATEMANEVPMEVLAGLRAAAEGLNVVAEDGLHAAVVEGLLAAAAALSAAGDLLQGDVASSPRVAGTGLRYSAKSLHKVTCSPERAVARLVALPVGSLPASVRFPGTTLVFSPGNNVPNKGCCLPRMCHHRRIF